jgi:hypothetical protein
VGRCGHSVTAIRGGRLIVWGGRNFQGGGGIVAQAGVAEIASGEGWRELGGGKVGCGNGIDAVCFGFGFIEMF